MTAPAYLPYYVLGGGSAIIATILIGLNRALVRGNWTQQERVAAIRLVSFVLIGWFAASVGLALLEAYRGASDRIPTIQYGVFIPILIGSVLIWRSSFVARLIYTVPHPPLCRVHPT